MALSQSEINRVFNRAKNEYGRLSQAEQNRIARSEQSFGEWLRNKVRTVAHNLGYAISFPFRVVGDFIRSFWEGLFG